MAKAKNEAKIRFTAETGEFNSAIKQSNEEMSQLRAELKLNETQMKATGVTAEKLKQKHEILTKQLETAKAKTEALSKKVDKAAEIYGENSTEVGRLKVQLLNAQTAEAKIEQAINECNDALKGQKKATKEAGEGFTVFKGVLADLASTGIQNVIGGIRDMATSFLSLSEETKETRVAFAKLEASFDSAGLEADYAYDTIYDLYGVLGDTDRATEASNLLAKICDNEQELDEQTRILTGVFALYGDSIPTEGLAEGIAATSEMGVVQGVLADALEWQGINLDTFNERLGKMNSAEERSAYITDTLTGLYGEAADAYRENNKNLIEANESQLRYNKALADLGEKSEPITTGLRDGFSHLLMQVRSLADDIDFEAIGASIEGAFKWFGEEMLPKIVDGVKGFIEGLKEAKTWIEEHQGLMLAVATAIGVVTVAIGAYNVVQGVKAAMDAAQVTTVWALVAAHLAQAGAAMAAIAPYILIVAAIAAVIAIIVVCIKHWDDIVKAVKNCWEKCKATLAGWGSWINKNVIKPVGNFFTGLWKTVSGTFTKLWTGFKDGARNAWEGVKSVFSKVGDFFSRTFNTVKDKIISVFRAGGEVFNNIKDGIVSVFKTVVNGIIRGINRVIATPFRGLNRILDRIQNVSVAGIQPFSWMSWRAPIPEIPLLAKGGILTKPTLNIAGEAGPEAIIPIAKLESYISNAINKTMNTANLNALARSIEDLASRPIELKINDRTFAVATAGATDSVNGLRSSFQSRGLVI